MRDDPPNPYIHASLRELFAALNERAAELLKADKPVGRRDTAYLLLAASKVVDSQEASIGSPAQQARERRRRHRCSSTGAVALFLNF